MCAGRPLVQDQTKVKRDSNAFQIHVQWSTLTNVRVRWANSKSIAAHQHGLCGRVTCRALPASEPGLPCRLSRPQKDVNGFLRVFNVYCGTYLKHMHAAGCYNSSCTYVAR